MKRIHISHIGRATLVVKIGREKFVFPDNNDCAWMHGNFLRMPPDPPPCYVCGKGIRMNQYYYGVGKFSVDYYEVHVRCDPLHPIMRRLAG